MQFVVTGEGTQGWFRDIAWSEMDEALVAAWKELVATQGLNPSLCPEWLGSAAAAWSQRENLRVAAFGRQGVVSAVVPFLLRNRRISGLPVRTLELGGNVVSYHQEVVAHGECESFLEVFLSHAQRYGWDALVVDNVTVGGPTDRALRAVAREVIGYRSCYACEASPFLHLRKEWESFVGEQRSSFRYRIRKAERDGGAAGGAEMLWYRREEEWPRLLEHILSIDDRSWKVREGLNISARPQERRYYELLLPVMARAGILFANVLLREGQAIAYSLCYAAGRQVGQMKTSFDDRFSKGRPGFVATVASIRRAAEEGFAEYDFLGDEMRHKSDWTTSVRPHVTHILFRRSPRGLLLGATKRFIKAIVHARERVGSVASAHFTLTLMGASRAPRSMEATSTLTLMGAGRHPGAWKRLAR